MNMEKPILVRELLQLCDRNRDGSFSTQAARKDILILVGRQLLAGGFRSLGIHGLKPKHVSHLVARWQDEKLSAATVKNRLAHLRWWAEKVRKASVIPRTNAELGIGRRCFVSNTSKARDISVDALEEVDDERLRCSIRLQQAFGLRREECLKFQPAYAMQDGPNVITLKASWCKGGRERQIPITNDFQREVLAQAVALAEGKSMIPSALSYRQWLKRYENATTRAGLSRLHGLRHAYAQRRYLELAGWECPAQGGPTSRQLTPEQQKRDFAVRLQISRELGHNREAITAVYLGR